MDRTVLIVDDDALARRSMERMFRKAGWHTLVADGVHQAVELLPQADVVLSDYNMLDGTGDDVIKQAGDVPVVILSGSPERIEHEYRLVKPSSTEEILSAVNRLYFHHHQHSRR